MLQFLVRFTATTMQRANKRNAGRINYATLDAKGFDSAAIARVECPMCHTPDQPDDALLEVIWYGCDHCDRWWHRHCILSEAQTIADLSCIDKSTTFRSPACPEMLLCEVCFSEDADRNLFAICDNCWAIYHKSCLPSNYLQEYLVYTQSGAKWYCSKCDLES